MTIKEVEQCLGVPRATVRFYEKEGLLSPTRGENGYREYSEEDVVQLKKIIILRKLGFAVSDIEDVLDGAKPMSEALESNIENLTRQMQELQGAMTLCRKMQENGEQIETFDAEKYWNAVEEEERKGNRFLDIAKDVVKFEKGVVLEYLGLADFDGNPKSKREVIAHWIGFVVGVIAASCLMVGLLDIRISVKPVVWGVLLALLLENVIKVPIYLLSKKYPKVKANRDIIWMIFWVVVIATSLILLKVYC